VNPKSLTLPLYLSIRFDENPPHCIVIYNNFKNGTWGKGEGGDCKLLKKNGEFDLRLRIIGSNVEV
jgi:hypothetical protein